MEIKLREEARSKGLPEEMINKLIPLRSKIPPSAPSTSSSSTSTSTSSSTAATLHTQEEIIPVNKLSYSELSSRLNNLATGDPVKFSAALDRLKKQGSLALWDSEGVSLIHD